MNIITDHKMCCINVVNAEKIKEKYIVCQLVNINGINRLMTHSGFADEADAIDISRQIGGVIVENIYEITEN